MRIKVVGKPIILVVSFLVLAFAVIAFFGIKNHSNDAGKDYSRGAEAKEDDDNSIESKGGIEVIFHPDTDAVITDADMDETKAIIEARLNNKVKTGYEVQADYAEHQIIVRLPWSARQNNEDLIFMLYELGERAQLLFYNGDNNEGTPFMTGEVLEKATAGFFDGDYIVTLEFNSEGAAAFETATAQAVANGTKISIYKDDQQIYAAECTQAITGGKAIIFGNQTEASTQELADILNAGSLPFALTFDDSEIEFISPSQK